MQIKEREYGMQNMSNVQLKHAYKKVVNIKMEQLNVKGINF